MSAPGGGSRPAPLGIALLVAAGLVAVVAWRGFAPVETIAAWLVSLAVVGWGARRAGAGRAGGGDAERIAAIVGRGDWHALEELAALDGELSPGAREALRAHATAVLEARRAAGSATTASRDVARLSLAATEHSAHVTAAIEPARASAAQGLDGARRAGEVASQVAIAAGAAHAAARESLDAVAHVADVARGGTEHAQAAAEASSEVHALVRDLQERLRVLRDATETVGDITNVVSGIGRQTHLLALNASIEAARAGIHGKGFAVVAEEVGKLAAQSAGSIRRIEDLVKQITERTTDAAEQARRMARAAGKGETEMQEALARARALGEDAARAQALAESAVEAVAKAHALGGPLGEGASAAVHGAEGAMAATTQAVTVAERQRSVATQLREAVEGLDRATGALDAAVSRLGGAA